jgi:hypothetical protein
MTTANAPESRSNLVDPETAARLRVEAGIIKTLATSARAAGDDSLSIHLDAIEMADELREYHNVISRQARAVGNASGMAWYADRECDAEQLMLHHLDMLDRWLHREPKAKAPAGQCVEIVIQDMPDGMPVCEMAFIPQVNSAKPKTPAMELADAFLKAIDRVAEIEPLDHVVITPQKQQACSKCHGMGWLPSAADSAGHTDPCHECNGTGKEPRCECAAGHHACPKHDA